MVTRIIGVALVALSLAACATPQSSAPAPETAERAALIYAEATVETVDQETRQVLLRNLDGSTFTVTAGPDVRNLAQVSSGDKVRIGFYEAVALTLVDPADPGGGVALVAADRAPEGARPAAAAGTAIDVVVEFVSYDPGGAIATFIGPDSVVYATRVHPKMRDFVAARTAGDRVEIMIEQAVAVEVAPI